ncbi:SDR family oxidoreductase [Tumidithrix elongata RA019]|uniref:SDR family oxidoreductase n=1 Tax=Tumidithrix elongata BACA0141 TaxID=2716417 RepID=A0AAW9PTD9_9CYAN|nr:SDR family oxidoreductase [Tumidithrix elongata RA019]
MIERIFLAGASRGVGREIAKYLTTNSLFQNHPIVALLRDVTYQVELEAMGISVAIADALHTTVLEQIMLREAPDLVVSTIGGLPKDGVRADFLGNKNLIDSAVKAGIKKFILISSIGSGDSAEALPSQALQALKSVLIEKAQAENYLIASGLTYTIIRPGGLKSEPPTGKGILTENPKISGTIHRADVADLVCQCLRSDRCNNKILAAIDRDKIYNPIPFEEFLL